MSNRFIALRRMGVAAVAAATLGAGLPVFLSGSAAAQGAPTLTVTADGATTPGQCESFTVTRSNDPSGGTDTPTATITVREVPNSGSGDITFCDPATNAPDAGDSTAGDGVAIGIFVAEGNAFTFLLIASAPITADVIAESDGFISDSETVVFATQTASPSATPSATISPSATPSATMEASPSPSATQGTGGGGNGGVTPASPSPSASASPRASVSASPSPTTTRSPDNNRPPVPPGCARAAEVMLGRTTIIATGSAPVSVNSTPNSTVDLFAYTRPSTVFRLVRSGTTDSNGNVTFADLRPPANTRLQAQQRGCAFGRQKVLNVRTQLSLNVVRNGKQIYTFSGRALPARNGGLIVSLYRVTNDGRQILTSQTRANASNGQYVINRRFTGTGRFGFVVRTGQDLQNAPGSSNIRSLLVF